MRDSRKHAGVNVGSTTSEGASASPKVDPATGRLTSLGKRVGNDEVQRRLDQGNASRDQMLSFLCDRLEVMREVQLREIDTFHDQRTWWKKVSDQLKPDYTKPEPTRWHEAAELYKRASYKLCRGEVGQGAQLLKAAQNAEERAFGGLTKVVEIDDLDKPHGSPAAADGVDENAGAGACEEPAEVSIADEIITCMDRIADPPGRKRKKDPWWTEEEEEEEEGQPSEGAEA